jgi:Ca2+-binding EF-hand superfamily protein
MVQEVGGSVGFDDFMRLFNRVSQTNAHREDEIRESFRTFDKEGNGLVNVAELRYVMTHLGEKMTDKEFEEMIRGRSKQNFLIDVRNRCHSRWTDQPQ